MNPNVRTHKEDDKWEYKLNTVYEFTISPAPKHQYINKKDARIRHVTETVKEMLPEEEIKYHLFPETTQKQYGRDSKNEINNVHFHGVLLFPSALGLRRFLLNYWHKLTKIASIQVNEYRPDHWPEYCRKQKWLFPERCYRIKNASWDAILEMAELTIK